SGADTVEIPDGITEEDVLFLENLDANSSPEEQYRAERLCAFEPPNPWNMLVITFTNKAADELKERLSMMLGDAGQDVWAMTFHSACCKILRREIDRLGFNGSFTIYDTSDSERMMKHILQEMDLDEKTFSPKAVLHAISKEKDKMVSPEELLQQVDIAQDFRMYHIARAYQRYQARLKENNALDFDDIIVKTVQLLQENEDVRTFYQRKFRYVMVDEYQDTNHAQYLLTSLLAGGLENICVVGDDDQSIYRFRGATIENILDFEKQYTCARIVRLEQNYRSTQTILNAANAVIARNIGRKGKRLWTENDIGTPITVYEAGDEGQEARYIADQIFATIEKSKRTGSSLSYRNHAILYRTNAQSNALEYAFKRSGIRYRIIGGTRFFERAEIKDMLAYLCVINNKADELRLRRIINNPPRGLGAKTIEIVDRMANAEGMGLYKVVSDPYSYGPLEKSAAKLMQFAVMIEELTAMVEQGMSLPEFYDELLTRSGYVTMLESKPTEENKSRLENVRELKSSIIAYVENAEEPTLAGFLEEIALYTDIDEYDSGDDAVSLMTMHAAKGLEFDHVFLVGFEDGLFPGMRAIGEPDEMEEERRLCYVAITRAKKTLTISYARQRMLYGKTGATIPSRFLREIPEDLTLRKGQIVRPMQGMTSWQQQPQAARRPASIGLSSHSSINTTSNAFIDYKKGDMVKHTAFGRGMVVSVLKTGGDALLEIVFDEIGTKHLMAKAASTHLKRV
ncbi:MAG: UvrD-helicase domain-containing protein, partial [Oscillospiraceae bacterium]|nr:UvrD-helicase domain-containing protein [Oscillospiraceae bacterium]